MQGLSSCACRGSLPKVHSIVTVRWACGHTCAGRSVAVPTSYAQGWMLSSTEPVLYLGVVSDDIRSAMMYGPSPIEAMIVAVRLRDAIERYNREWHQRSLDYMGHDQDDEREQCNERAGTTDVGSDADADIGVGSSSA